MAGLSPITADIGCKLVQEIVKDGDEIPDKYVSKDFQYGAIDDDVLIMDIPLVDMKVLTSSSACGREELGKLQSALCSWGCFQFQAINHGIEESLIDEVHKVSRQFFELSMEEKQKYARAADDIDGYGNDMVLYENQTLDWNDRIYLKVHPENDRKLKYWPENPKSFREILEEYTSRSKLIAEELLKSMARCLNLPDDRFLKQYGDRPVIYARFNFYPPCPRPKLVRGLKPHADGTAITILLHDKEVEGLQVLKDNKWYRVPIMPYALLVIVGDQVEIMSNGLLKSPVHRAVTNSEKERITVAMFCSPESGIDIEPVEELIDDKRPRLYKTAKDYLATYFQYYQQGKRPIDAVKI
uniref:Protein SRG1 isoform X1 n=2 Tax=Nicotiana sylvestris TaxID=4096 RepID=A0A1U7YG71_NICSY|nr:PREDICTED: protein SRG1 isoform X1 [Nicotiana sylvestris]